MSGESKIKITKSQSEGVPQEALVFFILKKVLKKYLEQMKKRVYGIGI